MAKLYALLTTVFIILVLTSSVLASEQIAILDFKSLMAPEDLGVAVAEILRTELIELSDYTVIERGMLKQLMEEQALQMSGSVDSETAVKIGKLIGANLVVTGSIIKTGNTYTINSRLVEVETGIVKTGKNIRGQEEDQISSIVHDLALMIAGKKQMSDDPAMHSDSPAIYQDDFTSGINQSYWKIETNQSLYQIDDKQGAIRFYKQKGGEYSFQSVGLVFLKEVCGDFDVRINFRDAKIDVDDGSAGNQVQLNIGIRDQVFIVVYSDEAWLGGHNVHVWADPPRNAFGTRKMKVSQGLLRISRIGSSITGYLGDTMIYSSNISTEPVTTLSFTLNNNGTKDATSVAFDDFYLSCDQLNAK